MPIDGLFGNTVELLGKTLDLRAKRNALVTSNIANAETPNYTPTDLSFDAELQSAMGKGRVAVTQAHPRHIPLKGQASRVDQVQGEVVEVPGKNRGPDGNAVELETEMGKLSENQIMYNATVQLLSKKFEGLKQAIRGTL
jgi:flagellar basal-body rod protein FlgB